jgi:hypothetical protein
MSKYFIGSKGFKTKKDCETYTRNIVNELKTSRITKTNEYFNFFNDLIKNHPEYDSKIGCGIDYFFIQPNVLNKKTYQTMIKRLDESIIDFSWVYCCQFKVRSSTSSLITAMRQAIAPDMIKFKREQTELKCCLCKASTLDYSDYHVDHNDPPFRTIRDNYTSLHELLIPSNFDSCPQTYLTVFKEEDNIFKTNWIKYHNENCTLQILCRDCNLKKH